MAKFHNSTFLEMKLFKTYTNQNGKYDIYCGELIKEGPLNQVYALFFEIKKNDTNLFSAYISITDQLVHILKGFHVDESQSAKEILDIFGYLRVLINIENKNNSDFTYQFNSKNYPGDYEVCHKRLENELAWAKIKLVKDSKNKYIIFNGFRHYIPNPITRNALGYEENRFIPKTDTEISKYPSGENIDSVQTIRLVRNIENSDPVYAVFNNPTYERRHIPDQETLRAIGQGSDKVSSIIPEDFNNIPEGKPLVESKSWDIQPIQKNIINKKTVNKWYKSWWANSIFWPIIIGLILLLISLLAL